MAIWKDKIKARLQFNPLYFIGEDFKPTCKVCADASPRSKEKRTKIALYRVINYSFDTCQYCRYCASR